MSIRQGIILLCHGSRDPAWLAPFEAIRDEVAAIRPECDVRIACLQFRAPTLTEAAEGLYATGVRAIAVLPMFMSRGGHVARDVPDELERLRSTLPGVTLTLAPSLGEMPDVRSAIAQAVSRVCVE
jgi:sirohydrochlorin cobaltochelatase